MSEQDIQEALGAVSPNSPIWLAVIEMLQSAVDEAVHDCQLVNHDDGQRHFHAGRLNQAVVTRNTFIETMAAVRRKEPTVGST